MKILSGAGIGTGAWFNLRAGGRRAKENVRTLYFFGTFNGATVTVEVSPDGGTTAFAISGVSFTSAGMINIEARADMIRGVVTGGTSPAVDLVVL